MLSIKYVAKSAGSLLSRDAHFCYYSSLLLARSPITSDAPKLNAQDIVASFKSWFKARESSVADEIFTILTANESTQDGVTSTHHDTDIALAQLNLRLTEKLVLEVLSHGASCKDVLSCLKFFDWAGRQPGFYHTRSTFYSIFKILSRAKLMSLTLQFLQDFKTHRLIPSIRFHETLVMGYAIAGKPDVALQLFGRMRFQGLDLDPFSYHVILNAFVEEGFYDAADMIAQQISLRSFDSDVTYSIKVKSFCKQSKLEEAQRYILKLLESGKEIGGGVVSVVVDALCKHKMFERAGRLMEEHKERCIPMERSYGIWLRNLTQAGKIDGALEFLRSKKQLEGYVPEVFRYNYLIFRLLRENRLEDVCDLLIEMEENQISPDKVTMNAVLCFFCKAGMLDVSIELYNSRSEFGLSPNTMAYNYLINTLCGYGSVEEAYKMLKNSIHHGYFPGRKTFSILADALCSAGELDKMKELVFFALDRKFVPSSYICNKFIGALCRSRRMEDGYLIHGELNRILNKSIGKNYYSNLIHSFSESKRGDIAARLLIEMQERGHKPARRLFRAVILCLFKMENPQSQFFRLLEMQLSHHGPSAKIYDFFVDGAGHAKKPELAREVYKMMWKSGIEPSLKSDIHMLKAYLNNGRIADALNFFNDLCQRRKIGRKLYDVIVVGLCQSNKPDFALDVIQQMKNNMVVPSKECYEVLIQLLCRSGNYDLAVNLVNDFEKTRHRITTFTGNVLLLHAYKNKKLYETWIRMRDMQDETSNVSLLGLLIGVFSGCIRVPNFENLEELIEQCFRPDIYTYNLLLRKLCRSEMERACELFDRICQKGYVPDQWTYEIMLNGFLNHGGRAEAKRWVEEMSRKGFGQTRRILLSI
ncbi:hypothetical protein SLA2020_493810 [Shorea laevis]